MSHWPGTGTTWNPGSAAVVARPLNGASPQPPLRCVGSPDRLAAKRRDVRLKHRDCAPSNPLTSHPCCQPRCWCADT